MKARVQRWGNSLAVKIPKPLVAEIGIVEESEVEISVRRGRLALVPVARSKYLLGELLSFVTIENLHGEFQTGPGVGRESW